MKTTWLVLVLWSVVLATGTKITIDSEGGYSDIVIQIADDVPEEQCQDILANAKRLFDDSSLVLYEALNYRVFFKSVNVIIPKHWRDSRCGEVKIADPESQTAYRHPDILVSPAKNELKSIRPETRQSRGCGQPGDLMDMPHQFLSSNWNSTWERLGDPAKLFVHEWSKLRYGIFDEIGYRQDPLFPHFHVFQDRVVPTGTSNMPVEGVWVRDSGEPHCDPTRDVDCTFRPFAKNELVTCSLGYYSYLPSVSTYCDAKTSQFMLAPTKHNVWCQGQSAMEVINKHSDFADRNTDPDRIKVKTRRELRPTLNVYRRPEPQFVLVMEASTALDSHGQWKWINKAAQKFIRYDLPINAKVAIVSFSNSSKIQHNLAQIRHSGSRARLADAIPDKYHLSSSTVQCTLCGIQKAVHDVLKNNKAGAHIILVTRGSKESLSLSDEQTIDEYVRFYNIKMSTILVSDSPQLPSAFYDHISQTSGGKSYLISNSRERSIETYLELVRSFGTLLQSDLADKAVTVHENVIDLGGHTSTSGRFSIDSNLGRDTKFGVYVNDGEDHLIKSVTFTDSRGHVFGPYTSMSSVFDNINLKVINFPDGIMPPFDEFEYLGAQWQYTIEWIPGASIRQKSAVVITSKPRTGPEDFVIEVWTNSDLPSDMVESRNPLAVFARVTKGDSPVIGARVEAQITIFASNGTSSQTLRLLDNGNGDPDLQSGDGVYSRYITKYLSTGRYDFTIIVDDNHKRAFTIGKDFYTSNAQSKRRKRSEFKRSSIGDLDEPPAEALDRCCGSRILVPDRQRVFTKEFQRTKKGPVIHLITVPNPAVDLMPPSRITDLTIDRLGESNVTFLATWTAPGDDFDVGTVTGYKFFIARSTTPLLNLNSEEVKILKEFNRPDPANTQTSFQFEFHFYDLNYYVGLVAVDERQNEGKMSNLVRIYVDSHGLSLAGDSFPVHTPSVGQQGQDEGVMIGILCGTFLVIALLLWGGIWYLRRHQGKSTKKSGVNATLVAGANGSFHDTSSSDLEVKTPVSPRRQGPSSPSVPNFSSLASGGAVGTFPRTAPNGMGSKADVNTPTYWSASKLLEEHEQRTLGETYRSTTTYHNNHPAPLDPIVEDPEDTYGIGMLYAREHQAYPNNHTSTPIKYSNLTLPRRGQSVSPSPVGSDSMIGNTSRGYLGYDDTPYGYAHSEPPNGLYGTMQRRSSGRGRVPPAIPPKPSLSALLGLNHDEPLHGLHDDVPMEHGSTNGLSVRNISHV